LHVHEIESWLKTVWLALEGFRKDRIPEGERPHDRQWNDISTAMAWIREELDLPAPF